MARGEGNFKNASEGVYAVVMWRGKDSCKGKQACCGQAVTPMTCDKIITLYCPVDMSSSITGNHVSCA